MDKAALRGWAKELRKGLPTAPLSARLSAHLAGFLAGRGAGHVLLYSAFGSELDPGGLPDLYPATYYLPRARTHQLEVHPLPCRLVRHRYGFWEPAPDAPWAEPGVLQAVLVPGLAFDRRGHRLGYGQGFYDRFLARLGPGVLTVGVVPDALRVDRLPADPWDVPVGFTASESGVWPSAVGP